MSANTAMAWLSAGSLLVAVIAIGVAIAARGDAAKANLAATQANGIARKANTHAEDANKIAMASNDIAKSASEFARGVPTDLAWDQALIALSAIQTADIVGQERKEARMGIKDARTAILLLNDRMDSAEFADWTYREMRHGMARAYEATLLAAALHAEARAGGDVDTDEIMALNRPFQSWVAAFINNLRLCRRRGFDSKTLVDLAKAANEGAMAISTQHGFNPPSDTIPGLTPLYPERID